jgi:DNA-binding transcriptional MerR regulator
VTEQTDQRRRITAHEAPDTIGVPAATVRSWASRGLVYSCGLDGNSRPIYWQHDLEQLRDRPRRGPRQRVTVEP